MYGVFAVGENVFGNGGPTATFDTEEEARLWIRAMEPQPGRGWVVRPLTNEEIALLGDDD